MGVNRTSDTQSFELLNARVQQMQLSLVKIRDKIATGQAFTTPDENPLGASTIVRLRSSLSSLAQYDESAKFGNDVLTAEYSSLRDAKSVLDRADEIASQQSTTFRTQADRNAAAEEVHGLLQEMTSIGNTSYAGRRVYSWLAQDGTAPFADPDSTGYDPSTAFTGGTNDFSVKVGPAAGERVRVTTQGGPVFTPALQALSNLEQTLRSGGDVASTFAGIKAGQDAVAGELASVGSRQNVLQGRISQVKSLSGQEQTALARTTDADLIQTISELTQVQTALQALLTATGQIAQQNLASLIRF